MQATDSDIVKLIQFDNLWLNIADRTWARNTGASLDFAYAEFFEAYFWLALGVELGYFPGREARLLASQRFTSRFQDMLELFRFKNYLVNPSLADRLVSDQNRRALLSVESGKSFERRDALLPAFERALALETEVATDYSVRAFSATLASSPTDEIKRALVSDYRIASGFADVDGKLLIRAFAVAIQHMESFGELRAQVSGDDTIEPEDRGLFKSRIHQLVHWRMNFQNEQFETSFKLVASEFLESMPPAFQDPAEYWKLIDGLALAWTSGGGTVAAH